jgi:hypothetical protein
MSSLTTQTLSLDCGASRVSSVSRLASYKADGRIATAGSSCFAIFTIIITDSIDRLTIREPEIIRYIL